MTKTTVEIDGMMCGMCEAHVNDAIRKAFTVKSVKASRKKKLAEIVSNEDIDAKKLKDVIDATGYTSGKVQSEPYKKAGTVLKRPKNW